MNVLITGGAGYIGSVLSRMLIERGYKVTILDTFYFGEDSVKDIRDQVKLVKADIRDVGSEPFRGIDAVINMAAISNDPSSELQHSLTESINHVARSRVVDISKKMGVKRHILASSCSIYGYTEGVADENAPVHPLTIYAQANRNLEVEALALADSNFCVTSLRQATVYGISQRMRFDLIVNTMTLQLFRDGKITLLGDGGEYRPFVHVKDTSMAFIKALEADPDKVNKEVFNVGEVNMKLLDLTKYVTDALNLEYKCDFGSLVDKRNYQVSFDKIKGIGWKPQMDVKEGSKEVWNALQKKIVDGEDPRTITVKWYKKLIAANEVKVDG